MGNLRIYFALLKEEVQSNNVFSPVLITSSLKKIFNHNLDDYLMTRTESSTFPGKTVLTPSLCQPGTPEQAFQSMA